MFHNVLFVVLLIISLYFAVLSVKKKKTILFPYLFSALGGAFLGLAIITRTSELLWLAPLWLILWLANFRKVGVGKLIIFIASYYFSLAGHVLESNIIPIILARRYNEMNQSNHEHRECRFAYLKTQAIADSLKQINNNISFRPAPDKV